jgi:RNA polymerase II subunit A C-terminal domain phosphatase SSU72
MLRPTYSLLYNFVDMDPRRARDPRLVRADPRLHQRQSSGIPSGVPQSTPPLTNQWTENGVAQRPLFCVVCASNQVSLEI